MLVARTASCTCSAFDHADADEDKAAMFGLQTRILVGEWAESRAVAA